MSGEITSDSPGETSEFDTTEGDLDLGKVDHDIFMSISHGASRAAGSRWAFLAAVLAVLVWGITGPFFRFSETWQLIINTGTTIVTFLMVFLIQNAQNREMRAIHLKLDELILAAMEAKNELIDIEELSDAQLERLADRYHVVSKQAANPPQIAKK